MNMQDLYFSLPIQEGVEKKWTQLSVELDEISESRLVASIFSQLAKFSGQKKLDILINRESNSEERLFPLKIDITEMESVSNLERSIKSALDEPGFHCIVDSNYPLIVGNIGDIEGRFVNIYYHDNEVIIKYIEGDFHDQGMPLFISEIKNIYRSKEINDISALQGKIYPEPLNFQSKSIIDIFLDQVDLIPERIAIIDDDIQLSYEQLKKRVLNLAFHLNKNISTGDNVAVLLPRSSYSLVAMLAIAYCGAVYVPMDDKYPLDHLLHITNLTNPVIIIQSKLDTREFDNTQNLIIEHCLQDDKCINVKQRKEQTIEKIQRDLLLPFAVLFTSGSTGRAKAVVHNQLSFIGRFFWLWDIAPFRLDDVVAQRTTIGFGPHIWEFLGGVLKGVKTIVLADDTISNPVSLAASVVNKGITRLSLVPSLARELVDQPNIVEQFNHLRLCSIAGEAMSVDLLNQLLQKFPNTKFYNDFGSTEANCLFFHPLEQSRMRRLPLGVPSSAARISILDEQRRPVLPFQPGILHVGGPTLALGYLHGNGSLEPLRKENSDLMNTGDVVYYEPSGVVVPLGRQDNIVKIRGMRVDLKNTESTLKDVLGLQELSLVVQETKKGEKQLIAFYTDQAKEGRALKRLVGKFMPEHLCPVYFLFLGAFPLLKNGKLDRQSLIKILEGKGKGKGKVDSISEKLFDIICELTELPHQFDQAFEENITDLGINSLLMASFLKAINDRFKLSWKIYDLIEKNSIKSICNSLEQDNDRTIQDDRTKLATVLNGDIKEISRLIAPTYNARGNQHILLTGATGFLGGMLVRHLLESREGIIYCPVRASSDFSAERKFRDNLSKYNLEKLYDSSRIKIISAHLDLPNMGLKKDEFESFAGSFNEVFHCASEVNHIYNYNSLRHNHMGIWRNLTSIMNSSKIKNFHFISSVAVNRQKDVFLNEEVLHERGESISSGYGQCKWSGEKILAEYSKRYNTNTHIYRLGELAGDSNTGIGRTDDIIHNILALLSNLEYYPLDKDVSDLVLDVLPVNWACDFICIDKKTNVKMPNIYHLSLPTPINLTHVLDVFGVVKSSSKTIQQWFYDIHCKAQDKQKSLINGLSLFTDVNKTSPLWFEYFSPVYMTQSNTLSIVKSKNINLPHVSDKVLKKYLKTLNNNIVQSNSIGSL